MNPFVTRWAVTAVAASLVLGLCWAVLWAVPWLVLGDRAERDSVAAPSARASPRASALTGRQPPVSQAAVPLRAAVILHAWDRRRSRAYARGDPDALSALYAPGSRAGRSDVTVLLDYARRGLRVEGILMQLLAVQVLEHAPGWWRLRVTDRVHGGVAVGVGVRLVLPRDQANTRVVSLRRASAAAPWRVSTVLTLTQARRRAWR